MARRRREKFFPPLKKTLAIGVIALGATLLATKVFPTAWNMIASKIPTVK